MCEIDSRQREIFGFYIVPNVQFCPVTYRKYANVFTEINHSIQMIPNFRTLTFRIPLAKIVTNREDTFFSTSFFFITTSSTNTCIKLKLLNSIEQSYSLQRISAC